MMQTFNVPLGGRQVNAAGTFLRYESAGAEGPDQTMRVRADGNDLGPFLPGDAIELPAACSLWELVPASCSANVKIGFGRITTVRSTLVGTVTTTQRTASFVNAPATVTTASAQMVAANPARAYLAVQNKSASGSIWLNFGAAATTVNGLLIGPGGYWEWDGSGTVPVNAVHAIGSIASNPDVLVIGG